MVNYVIKNYEIKYKNNTQILYIYLDYNSEFSKLSGKKNNKKLKSEVKKYIKKNKIDFKGTTVAIMVGGLMVGSIMLNKPRIKNINYSNNNNIVAILDDFNYGDELLQDEVIVDKEIEVLEVNENNEEKKVKEDVLENVVTDKKIENVSNKTNNTKKENTSKQESVVNEKESEEIKEEYKEEVKKGQDSLENDNSNVVDNVTYIKVYRNNGNVEKIELEEYIVGVVGAEMPASFNKEALKAQSVVARTYALKFLNSGKKITDSSTTQNYKNASELKSMWGSSFNIYYKKIVDAVNSTKGEYLTYNGEYIDAVYHSTSNGKTEDSVNVWGNSFPYLVSVDSLYDKTNKSFLVSTFFSYEDLSNKLNIIITDDSVFNIVSRNESGRVNKIEIDGVSYNGIDFRTLLSLRSTDFDIEKAIDGVNITTKGYGHGVGMSQYGANGMANNGYSYKDILLHYYRGVSLNK